MSDSDDDWFNKDLDEFVINKKLLNDIENISLQQSQPDTEKARDFDENRNNAYGGSYGERSTTNVPPMPAARLSFIANQTPVLAFLEIVQPDSGFFLCLKRKSNAQKTIILLSNAICKGMNVPFDENVKCLCENVVAEENFWNQYLKYLTESIASPPKDGTSKSQNDVAENYEEIWQCLTELCQAILNHEIRLRKSFLKKVFQLAENNKNNYLVLDIWLTNLKKCLEHEKSLVEDLRNSRNLYPSLDELKSDTLAPRNSTIFNGKYKDVEQYLDIHLSILREDYLLPLRDGFQQIQEKSSDSGNTVVYRHVEILMTEKEYRIIKTQEIKKTVCIVADLESKQRKRSGKSGHYSTQNYSHCFKPGSVLFFTTSEEFSDLVIAKIQSRDSDLLEHGYIDIVIIKTFNITSIFGKEFVMYERGPYFYREIYEVLRNFNKNTFPLHDHLINLDTKIGYPSYLPDKEKVIYKYRKHCIDIKNTSSWPSSAAFNLNENHLDALKQSLTQRICSITTSAANDNVLIASETIATLFQNTDAQILIVCHSGKVLTKILSDIEMYTQDIARIEYRKLNDQLDKFNLNEINSNYSSENIYKLINALRYTLHCGYRTAVGKFTALQMEMKGHNIRDNYMEEYLNIQMELESFSKRLDEMRQIANFECIKSKRIIGVTSSTASSKFQTLIQLLQTPIVIIEGAQRILEAHTIATLTTNVKHLILIGERQKSKYESHSNTVALSKLYKTSFSLFDRMIKHPTESGGNVRNWGPPILDILTSKKRKVSCPLVNGIEKFVFLLEHGGNTGTASNVMEFESKFLLALCNYLLKQGYNPDDITILTLTQEQKEQISIDREMYTNSQDEYMNLCKVRVGFLQSFKEKNNGIILLSTVRHRMDDNRIKNGIATEIQVLLSRTMQGIFIVGDLPSSKSLKKIRNGILEQNAIGSEMALLCQTHGHITKVKEAKDIEKLKFGGCEMLCNQPLLCGHLCENICHTMQYKHSECECIE